jgi:hypothetical protein
MYIDPDGHKLVLKGNEGQNKKYLKLLNKLAANLVYLADDGKTCKLKAGAAPSNRVNGHTLVSRVINNSKTCKVNYKKGAQRVSDNKTNIEFDPAEKPTCYVLDKKNIVTGQEAAAAYIMLAHELIHVDRYMRNRQYSVDEEVFYKYTYYSNKQKTKTITVTSSARREELATVGGFKGYYDYACKKSLSLEKSGDITENMIRKEHGVRLRGEYP